MRKLSQIQQLIVTLATFVVGIGLIVGGFAIMSSVNQQNSTYTGVVEATVTAYEVRQQEVTSADEDFVTSELADFYYPVFTYTIDGKSYEQVSDTGTGSKTYAEGSTVTLHYLPSNPYMFYVEGDNTRNYFTYAMFAAGAFCLFFGIKELLGMLRMGR